MFVRQSHTFSQTERSRLDDRPAASQKRRGNFNHSPLEWRESTARKPRRNSPERFRATLHCGAIPRPQETQMKITIAALAASAALAFAPVPALAQHVDVGPGRV